jgi:hypothetical protein
MHENGKMRPVETISGMGGRRIKESENHVTMVFERTLYMSHCISSTTII